MQIGRVRMTHYIKGREVGREKEIGLIEYDKGKKLICYIRELTEKQEKEHRAGAFCNYFAHLLQIGVDGPAIVAIMPVRCRYGVLGRTSN